MTESPTTGSRGETASEAEGDEPNDCLKFLSTGADLNNPNSDPDMRRIHTAADLHVTQTVRDALIDGSSPAVINALSAAGNLNGVIDRSQYEALIDQGTTADEAAARVAQDGANGGTAAERIAAVAATTALPSSSAEQAAGLRQDLLLATALNEAGVLGPDGQPIQPRVVTTSQEAEDLARLEGTVTAAAPTQASLDSTLATAANGITNLSRYQDGAYVPAAVTNLLPGYRGPAADPNGTRLRAGLGPNQYDPNDDWEVAGLPEYQGISNRLGQSTQVPGAAFGRGLGEAAIQAEKDLHAIAADYASYSSIDHVDGTSSLGKGAREHLDELYRVGEAPSNQLLGVTGRSTDASQSLLAAPENRHALIGAGWRDGTGAAEVLTTATRPSQPTRESAELSAVISRDLFTELGDNPAGWRELIPKDSQVSNALTELAASRIDTFAYPQRSTPLIQDPAPNPDGTWTAGVRLDSTTDAPGGDERTDYLKFLATGADLNNPQGDADMRRIHTAADLHVLDGLRTAVSAEGGDYLAAMRDAGNLTGVIDRSQYEALIDQGTTADRAAAQVVQDGATSGTAAVRMAERIAAVAGTSLLPSGIAPYVKDSFNAFFDSVVLGTPAAAAPATDGQAAALAADTNQTYITERDYLIVQALADADALPNDLPPTLFDNGRLRPFDELAAQGGNPIGDLNSLATTPPPGAPEWGTARSEGSQQRDNYFGEGNYLPQTAQPPPTPPGLVPRHRYEDHPW